MPVKDNGRFQLKIVPGSGLGILTETDSTVTTRPLTSLADEARKRKQKIPLIITKTNARSTVHRSGYLDYIGVLRFDDKGERTLKGIDGPRHVYLVLPD